eukprot:COSAG01_NODE_41465_length_451_cov_0.875000_1_plen_75_part_01
MKRPSDLPQLGKQRCGGSAVGEGRPIGGQGDAMPSTRAARKAQGALPAGHCHCHCLPQGITAIKQEHGSEQALGS